MTSELQGNVIDLCPVGALTSRPYQDSARPWELTKTESIDVMDAVGSNIRIDARGREVMRIMPRLNEAVNEEWISDKTRFIWDGLRTQRLDRPYVRRDGKLVEASWNEAFVVIKEKIETTKPANIGAIAGDLASVEDMFALKSLINALGSTSHDCREPGNVLDPANGRASYIFNTSIDQIEGSDALLLIGCDPRIEATILNARIRKRARMGDYPIGVVGKVSDLRYEHKLLGDSANLLKDLLSGKNKFAAKLKQAKRPMIIIGQGALNRSDSETILANAAALAISVKALANDWNGFNILHTAAARVGGLDIDFVPGNNGKSTAQIMADNGVTFLLGADELDMAKVKGFVIYIGSHGDKGAHRADVILPASAYSEKSGTYVNTEGRVQMANRAAFAPGDAKEDWAIMRALSAALGKTLAFNSLDELRGELYEKHPHMGALDAIAAGDIADVRALAKKTGKINATALRSPVKDFYLTNPIARASQVMAECSAQNLAMAKGKVLNKNFREAAE
ncbi:MAG: molybdopterin-dependent oxidoreductase, partial [Rhizobiaceae bacterium]|nr:molybdopterin-dependent oxidoreductase [Rhizobiaceae bacterium]